MCDKNLGSLLFHHRLFFFFFSNAKHCIIHQTKFSMYASPWTLLYCACLQNIQCYINFCIMTSERGNNAWSKLNFVEGTMPWLNMECGCRGLSFGKGADCNLFSTEEKLTSSMSFIWYWSKQASERNETTTKQLTLMKMEWLWYPSHSLSDTSCGLWELCSNIDTLRDVTNVEVKLKSPLI